MRKLNFFMIILLFGTYLSAQSLVNVSRAEKIRKKNKTKISTSDQKPVVQNSDLKNLKKTKTSRSSKGNSLTDLSKNRNQDPARKTSKVIKNADLKAAVGKISTSKVPQSVMAKSKARSSPTVRRRKTSLPASKNPTRLTIPRRRT